jgi:16S rRNA C967 or C1407 C5-methylase (RsmB/RsmF family)
MRLWHRLSREQRQSSELVLHEKTQLMQEIEKAHMDWITAQKRLDFVLEKEQIDYAVFALEAAEKRFEMLIKQAKNMKLSAMEVSKGRVMEG